MARTNYEKGRDREYRSMDLLERLGYVAYRSAGSHGVFDVIGISKVGVILIQCKLNCDPTPLEYEQMRNHPAPPNGVKLIHLYRDGESLPRIVEI